MSRAVLGLASAAFLVSLANASRLRGIPPPWTASLALSLAGLWACLKEEGRVGSARSVVLLCLTAFFATMRWHGGDDIPNSLIPFGILRDGTLSLEPFRLKFETERLSDFVIHGTSPLLSIFSPIPAVVALPVYVLPAAFGGPPNDFGLHNLSKIAGALLTALSVAVVYWACRRRAGERWSALCALWYGLGTWSWSVSSQALHSHAPTQVGAALGLWGLLGARPRDAALAGFGFALAFASREDSLFFLGAAGLAALLINPRRIWAFALGAAVPIGFNAAYWLWYTGVLKPPYMGAQAHMFGGLQWGAVVGMLLSPTRGLLFYCPAALFGLWAMARRADRRWAWPMLAATAALVLFLSFRTTWTGGQTFGPRYFAMASVLWAVALAELEGDVAANPRLRALFAAAFALSVVIHAAGGFFPYPGTFMTVEAEAELWRWDLHPLANLFRAEGPMGGLPAAARWAAALAFVGASIPLGRWAYRFAGLIDRPPIGQ
ncbi:hypothetical protein EPO15_00950 [bacterium]|nr:MAG: hypothetical protein EPO15_00950 [bacterium]